jgi:hypothetical protein
MEWLTMFLGPLSLAAGILLLLLVLALFIWAAGKMEGHDPINEVLARDNAAAGTRYALYIIAVVFALLGIFRPLPGRDPGFLGADGFIYQQTARNPNFDGAFPVIGSWVIDGATAGIGIRKSSTPVTLRIAVNALALTAPHRYDSFTA